MTRTIRLGILTLVALSALAIVSAAVAHRVVVIKGTHNGETLTGTAGPDRIHARGGDDTVNGGEGNDVLRGRWGNDVVNGDNGDDKIWVGRGADVESGGAGNDVMHALARDKMLDQIDCGDGVDTVWLNSKESDTYVNCEIVKTVVTNRKDDGE